MTKNRIAFIGFIFLWKEREIFFQKAQIISSNGKFHANILFGHCTLGDQ